MFEVGFSEIVLILGLALLVLGPEKLPGLVQKVGRWTGRARAMARQLRTQLEQEVTLDDVTRSQPQPPPVSPRAEEPAPHAQAAAAEPEHHIHAEHAAASAAEGSVHAEPAPAADDPGTKHVQ